jgi:hypothetical protein
MCALFVMKADDVEVGKYGLFLFIYKIEIQSQFSLHISHTNSVLRAVFFVRIILKFRT